MGPGVSCVCEIAMVPERLTNPTVGFSPTTPHIDDGLTIEPMVSAPSAAAARLAETAAADPELDPPAERPSAYGLRVSPPRALQPAMDARPRELAHSLRLVLPRMIHPAARSLSITTAS